MRHNALWISLFLIMIPGIREAYGDDPGLNVKNIPENLRDNSFAVVRHDEIVLEILDISNATLTRKRTVTILDQKYKDMAEVVLPYSPEAPIKKISGCKYDEVGRVLNNLRNKDIDDYSAYSGSFYDDNRMKVFDLSNAFYPFTYEYEYQQDFSSLMLYPDWVPLNNENLAVEFASFKVILPESQEFRYKSLNLDNPPEVRMEDGNKIYYWEIRNLESFEKEPNMPSPENYFPVIITSPAKFNFEGFEGDLSSWESYGKWIIALNKGRDELPEATVQKIKSMTDNIASPEEKIRILYDYLQQNTRYISIQLGIGGYQPMKAAQVDANGYGDCKALVNYMKSLLSAAAIKSYYTLVKAGSGAQDIRVDFPGPQFNHVILCVPSESDTIWLECTSQDWPFGFLGSFTGNRHVLIIRDKVGVIAMTPTYEGKANTQYRHISANLDGEGNARADVNTRFAGIQFENVFGILDAAADKQEKWLYDHLDIPDFNLTRFAYSDKNEALPEAEESLVLDLKRYAVSSGKRLFFNPNMMNRQNKRNALIKERRFDLLLRYSYIDIDTVEYTFPADYHLEYIPEPVRIQSKFGSYESRISTAENSVTYIRKRTAQEGLYPPEDYKQYVEFINRIAESDGLKLVLVKKT